MGRNSNWQRTCLLLKPDAYQRKLMGEIIGRIEKKGFTITAMKMMNLTEDMLRDHYPHIADKAFFPEILDFMMSAPVVAMIVEGDDVIVGMRRLMGSTHWTEALPGTIRGDYSCTIGENLIHGSDSEEAAEEEIDRFFVKY